MVAEDKARFIALMEVVEAALVHELKSTCENLRTLPFDPAGSIDLGIVFRFGAANLRKELLAHLDTVLAIAVLDDVGRCMRQDPRVVCTAQAIFERVAGEQARLYGILAVATNVGDDVRDAHHAALERHRPQASDDRAADRNAFIHHAVELAERGKARELKHALLVLAVMAERAVKRLKRDVAPIELVEHADRVHVMEEPATCALMEDVIQAALARVPERGVPQIVPEAYCLDKVAVQTERIANIACDARHELHMKPAA